MKMILDLINDIASNRTSGASEMAVQALQVIKQAVISSNAADINNFTGELQEITDVLASCRPTMVTINNCVQQFNHRLHSHTHGDETLAALRLQCVDTIDELEEDILSNKARSILNAANCIQTGFTLATCSYSSTLIQAIHTAVQQGKKMSLRILHSQSGAISYGQRTRLILKEYGLDCQMVADDLSQKSLDRIDLVLLGADAVLRDGSVLNGYPSLKLAVMAAAHNPPVPVYVISDSSKFCLDNKLPVIEPGFELIPGNLLTGLITEDGLFSGDSIKIYMDSKIRYVNFDSTCQTERF